jgi:hypothetical protein
MFGKWPNRIVVFCSAVANDPKQRTAPVIAAVIVFMFDWDSKRGSPLPTSSTPAA